MRKLSPEFMTALKEGGILYPILKAVQTDKDLIMEIRDDCIDIYYHGGRILHLERKENEYIASFDKEYAKDHPKHEEAERCLRITTQNEAGKWVDNIYFYKSIMDHHSNTVNREYLEKRVQQLIVQENNLFSPSESIDYFIIDFEYQCGVFEYQGDEVNTRFDLVGLFWDRKKRQKPKDKDCRLAIIEVKYGDGDSIDNKESGLDAHIRKTEAFLADVNRVDDFKKEMVNVFKQKRELNLLTIENPHEVPIEAIDDTIEFIIIVAGHNPGSSRLKNELEKMEPRIKKADVKFATSPFPGYALYKENLKSFTQFMKLLEKE